MSDIIKELEKLSREKVGQLQKAKNSGKKIFQYNGKFIPEEMIRAAGGESYLMCRGGEPEPPDAVLDNMLRFMNPLARSIAGYYELGLDPVMPIADLIVTQQTDNHIGRITELLEYKELPIWKIGVPVEWRKESAFNYYVDQLKTFRDKLEELTGNKVDDAAFRQNIEQSNRINALLREIDALRKKDQPPLGMDQFIRLNHYSYMVNPEIMIEKLEALLAELREAPGKFAEDAPRILIAGRAIAIGDYTIGRLVEESGAVIVTDLLDEGIRPYRVDVDLTADEDPLVAYAKARYLEDVPINIFQPAWKERADVVKELVKAYKVDGVLWYQLSFDEIYDMEHTVLAKWMKEENIPLIKMESSYEYSREAMGPLTTRVESFIASLKGGF